MSGCGTRARGMLHPPREEAVPEGLSRGRGGGKVKKNQNETKKDSEIEELVTEWCHEFDALKLSFCPERVRLELSRWRSVVQLDCGCGCDSREMTATSTGPAPFIGVGVPLPRDRAESLRYPMAVSEARSRLPFSDCLVAGFG